jgi:flagellar L-ring protein precursor FlgH
MRCRFVLLAALLLALPGTAAGQSLYRDGAPAASLFTDQRARAVNDLVTILIVEESSSSTAGNTKTSKDSSRSAGVGQFPTLFDPLARKVVKPLTNKVLGGYQDPSSFLQDSLNMNISGSGSHSGQGSIDRSDKVSGQIAARVVRVMDNGNLMLEGRRAVVVNDETQVITISGTVRQQDITSTNTVFSSQIADAEVQMEGKGIIADAQRPGIIYRLLDWLRIF